MRRPALAAAVLLVMLACGEDPPPAEVSRPCTGLLRSASAAAAPPKSLGLSGVTWYELQPQGASRYYFGSMTAPDVVTGRDELIQQLHTAGFTFQSTDAEPPAEAEATFTGSVEGSLQVIPLCAGTVRVRLRTSPKL